MNKNLVSFTKRLLGTYSIQVHRSNYLETEVRTLQEGIISPILADIYLRYVLDLWVEKVFRKETVGYRQMVRTLFPIR